MLWRSIDVTQQSIVLEELGNDGDEVVMMGMRMVVMRSVVKVTDNLVGMVERNSLVEKVIPRNGLMIIVGY
jgi:hypothetical protein